MQLFPLFSKLQILKLHWVIMIFKSSVKYNLQTCWITPCINKHLRQSLYLVSFTPKIYFLSKVSDYSVDWNGQSLLPPKLLEHFSWRNNIRWYDSKKWLTNNNSGAEQGSPCVSLHRAPHDPRSWRSPQKPRPTPSCLLRTTSTLIPLHPRTYRWTIRRQFCVLQTRSIRPILAFEVLDS